MVEVEHRGWRRRGAPWDAASTDPGSPAGLTCSRTSMQSKWIKDFQAIKIQVIQESNILPLTHDRDRRRFPDTHVASYVRIVLRMKWLGFLTGATTLFLCTLLSRYIFAHE